MRPVELISYRSLHILCVLQLQAGNHLYHQCSLMEFYFNYLACVLSVGKHAVLITVAFFSSVWSDGPGLNQVLGRVPGFAVSLLFLSLPSSSTRPHLGSFSDFYRSLWGLLSLDPFTHPCSSIILIFIEILYFWVNFDLSQFISVEIPVNFPLKTNLWTFEMKCMFKMFVVFLNLTNYRHLQVVCLIVQVCRSRILDIIVLIIHLYLYLSCKHWWETLHRFHCEQAAPLLGQRSYNEALRPEVKLLKTLFLSVCYSSTCFSGGPHPPHHC